LLNSGTDIVRSAISYTLGANVENLLLTGTASHETGNSSNNAITGSAGNNGFYGDPGNDTLIGGNGNDTLTGGSGTDKFVYTSLSESLLASFEVISDYTAGEKIDLIGAASSVLSATLTSSSGNADGVTESAISRVLTSEVLIANTAKVFTITGQAGVFLALNDSIPGFQGATDSCIQLSNLSTLGGSLSTQISINGSATSSINGSTAIFQALSTVWWESYNQMNSSFWCLCAFILMNS
jgi:hypothetical protein